MLKNLHSSLSGTSGTCNKPDSVKEKEIKEIKEQLKALDDRVTANEENIASPDINKNSGTFKSVRSETVDTTNIKAENAYLNNVTTSNITSDQVLEITNPAVHLKDLNADNITATNITGNITEADITADSVTATHVNTDMLSAGAADLDDLRVLNRVPDLKVDKLDAIDLNIEKDITANAALFKDTVTAVGAHIDKVVSNAVETGKINTPLAEITSATIDEGRVNTLFAAGHKGCYTVSIDTTLPTSDLVIFEVPLVNGYYIVRTADFSIMFFINKHLDSDTKPAIFYQMKQPIIGAIPEVRVGVDGKLYFSYQRQTLDVSTAEFSFVDLDETLDGMLKVHMVDWPSDMLYNSIPTAFENVCFMCDKTSDLAVEIQGKFDAEGFDIAGKALFLESVYLTSTLAWKTQTGDYDAIMTADFDAAPDKNQPRINLNGTGLNVEGHTHLTSVQIDDDLVAAKNLEAGQDLKVGGKATVGSQEVTGMSVVKGSSITEGDSEVLGKMTTKDVDSQNITAVSVNTAKLDVVNDSNLNNVNISGTLNVPGKTGTGEIETKTLHVTETSTLDGKVTTKTDLDVLGNTTLKKTDITGDLSINGNIIQNGQAYETHAEQLQVADNDFTLRAGATVGLGPSEYSGMTVENFDGTNKVLNLVVDNKGEARLGKDANLQPLLTRAEESDMQNFSPIIWEKGTRRAKTITVPTGSEGKVLVYKGENSEPIFEKYSTSASWSGTKEQFNKDKLIEDPDNPKYIEDGATVNIIGDPNDTLTVSTKVTAGDLNPVTSDAVAKFAQIIFDNDHPVYSTYTQADAGDEHNPNVLFNNSMIKSKWQLVNDPDHEYLYTVSTKEEIGNVREAGLPNITGTFRMGNDKYSYMEVSNTGGVFSSGPRPIFVVEQDKLPRSEKSARFDINYDASQGGTDPIYGKSTTVQPRSRAIGIWERTE